MAAAQKNLHIRKWRLADSVQRIVMKTKSFKDLIV